MSFYDKIRVCLIEDNDDDAFFIENALHDKVFELTRIENGRQGYEFITAKQQSIDVVILDNKLPYKDGLEIMADLKKQSFEIPVIFLTVDSNIDTAVEAMRLGAMDFLPKYKGYDVLPDKVLRAYDIHKIRLEKKDYEANLIEAKEAAEAANRAKRDFLSNMSHELRTPLNGVVGMTNLMLSTNMSEEQREYMRYIKISGEHLISIVNDLLNFSKIENGRIKLESKKFNLRETVLVATELLMPKVHEKGLRFIKEIPQDMPEYLLGDAFRLRQILFALLDNAVKFSEKGAIVFSLTLVSRDENFTEILFTVKDQGIGIDNSLKDLIFEGFQQADTSFTRQYGGAGLGLAIARGLIALMNGTIWVESQKGVGSTFFFSLKFNNVPKESI